MPINPLFPSRAHHLRLWASLLSHPPSPRPFLHSHSLAVSLNIASVCGWAQGREGEILSWSPGSSPAPFPNLHLTPLHWFQGPPKAQRSHRSCICTTLPSFCYQERSVMDGFAFCCKLTKILNYWRQPSWEYWYSALMAGVGKRCEWGISTSPRQSGD